MGVERGKGPSWAVRGDSGTVEVLLSREEIASAGAAERRVAGFDLRITMIDPGAGLEPQIPRHAQAIMVEVRPDADASLRMLVKMRADHPHARIIAAVRDPALSVVRALLRAGAHDVIALPLDAEELHATLTQLREDLAKTTTGSRVRGRVVSIVKSEGGVGATSILTQTAAVYAERERRSAGRETCLFDLDIQFGDACTYLGLQPEMGLRELLEAGSRVDGALLRSTATRHPTGLDLFAAPAEMMPLEAIDGEGVCDLVDLAASEYDTVFIDLPGSWTNWSLSVLARSDVVLLVTELTIASLRQARRVLDLIRRLDLGDVRVQVVINRMERKFFGSIGIRDAATALGRDVSFSISNDFKLMSTALDQGLMLDEVKPKNRISHDIDRMIEGIDMILAERN